MDTDADRLAMLQACGGVTVQAPNGSFTAIFDAVYQSIQGDPLIESSAPALTCRSSDVAELQIAKGQAVTVAGGDFRIMRAEPDGTGITVLVLKR